MVTVWAGVCGALEWFEDASPGEEVALCAGELVFEVGLEEPENEI